MGLIHPHLPSSIRLFCILSILYFSNNVSNNRYQMLFVKGQMLEEIINLPDLDDVVFGPSCDIRKLLQITSLFVCYR